MREIRAKAFQNEVVSMDHKYFIDCTFQSCTLRYNGGEFSLLESELKGCSWEFGGAAQRTLNVLECFSVQVRSENFPATRFV